MERSLRSERKKIAISLIRWLDRFPPGSSLSTYCAQGPVVRTGREVPGHTGWAVVLTSQTQTGLARRTVLGLGGAHAAWKVGAGLPAGCGERGQPWDRPGGAQHAWGWGTPRPAARGCGTHDPGGADGEGPPADQPRAGGGGSWSFVWPLAAHGRAAPGSVASRAQAAPAAGVPVGAASSGSRAATACPRQDGQFCVGSSALRRGRGGRRGPRPGKTAPFRRLAVASRAAA